MNKKVYVMTESVGNYETTNVYAHYETAFDHMRRQFEQACQDIDTEVVEEHPYSVRVLGKQHGDFAHYWATIEEKEIIE